MYHFHIQPYLVHIEHGDNKPSILLVASHFQGLVFTSYGVVIHSCCDNQYWHDPSQHIAVWRRRSNWCLVGSHDDCPILDLLRTGCSFVFWNLPHNVSTQQILSSDIFPLL